MELCRSTFHQGRGTVDRVISSRTASCGFPARVPCLYRNTWFCGSHPRLFFRPLNISSNERWRRERSVFPVISTLVVSSLYLRYPRSSRSFYEITQIHSHRPSGARLWILSSSVSHRKACPTSPLAIISNCWKISKSRSKAGFFSRLLLTDQNAE